MQTRVAAVDLTELSLIEPDRSQDELMPWPAHLGRGSTRLSSLGDGLTLGVTVGSLHRPVRVATEQPSSLVNLCFVAAGEIGAEPDAPLPALSGRTGSAFAWLLPQMRCATKLQQCRQLAAVDLSVSREFVGAWIEAWQVALPKAWQRAIEGQDVPLIEVGGLPPVALFQARQLIAQPGQSAPQRLRRESMALELLSNYLLASADAQRRTPLKRGLSPLELERSLDAASRLALRLAQPPGVAEMAQEVGLSSTRLRLAFRQLFGCGVYGYVKALRLEAARLALAEGRQVKAAALSVGYTKPGHFAREFRERFGIYPGRYAG